MALSSNENKMSDRCRQRAWPRMKLFQSYEV